MNNKSEMYELRVQRYLLSDTYYIHNSLRRGLISDWFSPGISYYLSDCIIEHYKINSGVVNKTIVRDILNKNNIPEATISLYETYIDTVLALEEDESNFDYWFEQLKNEYLGRQVKLALNVVIDDLKANRDYPKTVSLLSTKVSELDKTRQNFEEGYTLKSSAEARWDRYQDVKADPDKYKGIMCGFKEIDEATGGSRKGELNLIVASSGVGKSIMLNTISKNMYLDGHNVMFGGIEMSAEMNNLRFDSSMADLPFNFIRDGKLSDEEEEVYRNILITQKNMKNEYYYVPQRQAKTPNMIDLEIKEFIHKYGKLDALVVDYLNIMTLDNTRGMSTHEIQRAVAEEIRWLGIKHEIIVWSAAQETRNNKENEDKSTEIIALSNFIPATCDYILHIYQSKEDKEFGKITGNTLKARYSEKSKFSLRCNFKRMFIADDVSGFEGVQL